MMKLYRLASLRTSFLRSSVAVIPVGLHPYYIEILKKERIDSLSNVQEQYTKPLASLLPQANF